MNHNIINVVASVTFHTSPSLIKPLDVKIEYSSCSLQNMNQLTTVNFVLMNRLNHEMMVQLAHYT